jgi:hypothetical protein
MIRNILPLYAAVAQEIQMSSGVAAAINSNSVRRMYSYNLMGGKMINLQITRQGAAGHLHTQTKIWAYCCKFNL